MVEGITGVGLMRIFGIEIGKPFEPIVALEPLEGIILDESSTIKPELKALTVPESKRLSNIPKINPVGLTYSRMNAGRGSFQQPEYDLALINRIVDTDSYPHQAFV